MFAGLVYGIVCNISASSRSRRIADTCAVRRIEMAEGLCRWKLSGVASKERCEKNVCSDDSTRRYVSFLFHCHLLLVLPHSSSSPSSSSFISSLSPSFAPSSSSSLSLKLLTQLDGIKCSISSTCSISLSESGGGEGWGGSLRTLWSSSISTLATAVLPLNTTAVPLRTYVLRLTNC